MRVKLRELGNKGQNKEERGAGKIAGDPQPAGSCLPARMSEARPVPAEDSRPRQSARRRPREGESVGGTDGHRWSSSP